MLDVIKRYSEEKYYRKQDFMKEFDPAIAHVLWDETQQYRSHFHYTLQDCPNYYYVVLCRKVMFSLLHCERSIQYYCEQNSQRVPSSSTVWNTIAFDYVAFGHASITKWIHKACTMLEITNSEGCSSILTRDAPLLLRLFLCFTEMKEKGSAVAHLLLIKESKLAIIHMFDTQMRMMLQSDVCEEDSTYMFLKFIEHIELKISQGVLSLEHTCKRVHLEMDVQEIAQCYPQLSLAQISFYKVHKMVDHYYTISHFMEYTGVCYETARNAMDMFVNLHWYQKRKLGKKFVYFICES